MMVSEDMQLNTNHAATEYNDDLEDDDGKHLWSSILDKVQNNCRMNLPSRKAVIILGDNDGGKTSLAARLQHNEDPKESKGLEFHYVDIKDETRDESTRMSVWILDGDSYHSNLLKFALTEENMADSLVLLVASLSEPWKIVDCLNQWADILEKHINRLKISPDEIEELKASLVRHFQDYTPPTDETNGSSSKPPPASASSRSRNAVNPLHPPPSNDPDKIVIPLGEDVFTRNLGVPIVVVLTKSDCVSNVLERELDYKEEHLDFIQMHVRRFCLQHGAALFYLSIKEDRNCELLSRYIQHRIYGFPFPTAAYVVEKDCIFVPTGWDNMKKVNILSENLASIQPDAVYSDVITRPPVSRKSGRELRETEAVAEDEQVFLMRQQTALQRQAPSADAGGGSNIKEDGSMRPAPATRVKSGPSTAPGNAPGQEGVLANFFNSLLSKKPAGGGPPGQNAPPPPAQGRGPAARQTSKPSDSAGPRRGGKPSGPTANGTKASPESPQSPKKFSPSDPPTEKSSPEKDTASPTTPTSAPSLPPNTPQTPPTASDKAPESPIEEPKELEVGKQDSAIEPQPNTESPEEKQKVPEEEKHESPTELQSNVDSPEEESKEPEVEKLDSPPEPQSNVDSLEEKEKDLAEEEESPTEPQPKVDSPTEEPKESEVEKHDSPVEPQLATSDELPKSSADEQSENKSEETGAESMITEDTTGQDPTEPNVDGNGTISNEQTDKLDETSNDAGAAEELKVEDETPALAEDATKAEESSESQSGDNPLLPEESPKLESEKEQDTSIPSQEDLPESVSESQEKDEATPDKPEEATTSEA